MGTIKVLHFADPLGYAEALALQRQHAEELASNVARAAVLMLLALLSTEPARRATPPFSTNNQPTVSRLLT